MTKLSKLILINISLLFSFILLTEISLSFTRYIWQYFKPYVPPRLTFQLSPSTGHSHFNLADFSESPVAFLNNRTSCLDCKHISILVLGGSTSDPYGRKYSGDSGTWPEHLQRQLLAEGITSNISNYAQGGFNSSQELVTLLKATSFSSYDYIIRLTGINEYYFVRNPGLLNKPHNIFSSDLYLKSLNKNLLKVNGLLFSPCKSFICVTSSYRPAILSLFDFLRVKAHISQRSSSFSHPYAPPNYRDPVNHPSSFDYARHIFETNTLRMEAISDSLPNTRLITLLQPSMHIRKPTQDYFKTYESIHSKLRQTYPDDTNLALLARHKVDYLYTFSQLYQVLQRSCSTLASCTDISNLLDNPSRKLYNDPRHPNSNGNSIIASHILPMLK